MLICRTEFWQALTERQAPPHDHWAYVYSRSVTSDKRILVPGCGDGIAIHLFNGEANGISVDRPCKIKIMNEVFWAFLTGRYHAGAAGEMLLDFVPCQHFNGDDQLEFFERLIAGVRWVSRGW